MTTLVPVAVSPLRQRLIDEIGIRRFGQLYAIEQEIRGRAPYEPTSAAPRGWNVALSWS